MDATVYEVVERVEHDLGKTEPKLKVKIYSYFVFVKEKNGWKLYRVSVKYDL